MNERIKELAEQAWTMVSDEERARNELYEADTQRERRDQVFAELIVKECAEQIKTQGISASSEGYGDYEIGFNAGLFHALYTTKQHFGVEE